jgi:hypothetical protein
MRTFCMPIEPASWPDIVQLPAPAAADVEIVGVDVKVGVLESPLAPHARHNVATSARVVSNGSIRITSDYRVRTNRIARRARAATLTHRYAKPISMVRLGSYGARSLPEGVQFTGQQPKTVASVTSARRPRPVRQMSIYGPQIWLKSGLNFNTSEMLIGLSAFRSKRRCRETRTHGVEHRAVLQHVRQVRLLIVEVRRPGVWQRLIVGDGGGAMGNNHAGCFTGAGWSARRRSNRRTAIA